MNSAEEDIEACQEVAENRRAAFLSALPKDTLDREDAIAANVANANASVRSKLRRIYTLMDEMSAFRRDHVACKKGCSACCQMNITVSSMEAESIAAATGRPAAIVTETIAHPQEEFIGNPCPFLRANECSIYDHRPLACRKHSSYFTTEKWCSPPYVNTVQAPLVRFSGLDEALAVVSVRKGTTVFADIRDFFRVVPELS